jgi:hypothetical protein
MSRSRLTTPVSIRQRQEGWSEQVALAVNLMEVQARPQRPWWEAALSAVCQAVCRKAWLVLWRIIRSSRPDSCLTSPPGHISRRRSTDSSAPAGTRGPGRSRRTYPDPKLHRTPSQAGELHRIQSLAGAGNLQVHRTLAPIMCADGSTHAADAPSTQRVVIHVGSNMQRGQHAARRGQHASWRRSRSVDVAGSGPVQRAECSMGVHVSSFTCGCDQYE